MDDDPKKVRLKLLASLREEILRRQLSNTENYDKTVLSIATAFLGFSLAFLKDFVSYGESALSSLLPLSWALFGVAIAATILSFFASQLGLSKQLQFAEKYYLDDDDSYLTKANHAAKLTTWLNYSSGISFITAVCATIMFTTVNLVTGGIMNANSTSVTKGAAIPTIQKAPGYNVAGGAEIPTMQSAPKGPASGSQQTPSPSGGKTSDSK